MEAALTSPAAAEAPAADPARTWRPLRFFNIYRLGLAALFTGLAWHGKLPPPLGSYDPQLFLNAGFAYLLLAIASLIASGRERPGFRRQLFAGVVVDIAVLTAMMHASGGVSSGLGMLLVVSVANASMITAGRMVGLFAAMATLAVLLEQGYAHLTSPGTPLGYPHAGMLGVALFATAVLAHVMARRAKESEALAVQREVDLANMAQLTEYIIDHMQTGVVAVDPNGEVRFINGAAARLLDIETTDKDRPLAAVSPALAESLARWRQQGGRGQSATALKDNERLARFTGIGRRGESGVLAFVEDASRSAEQLQQVKLAALGRLTASIAHEIRNPLGAISHAGQLLAESPALDDSDRRLTHIILDQSKRVNTIIESVLQLGRRDRSRPEELLLGDWLHRFADSFRETHRLDPENLEVALEDDATAICFDPVHLDQVLTNLCENALRYADPQAKRVAISAARDPKGGIYLEVRDNGPGIAEQDAQRLFEPFFTTGEAGTGLGLYIARQLAECNHARLNYRRTADGACFRMSFPEPEPVIE